MRVNLNSDEVIRRLVIMGGKNRLATIAFHHYIINKKLITIEQAGILS